MLTVADQRRNHTLLLPQCFCKIGQDANRTDEMFFLSSLSIEFLDLQQVDAFGQSEGCLVTLPSKDQNFFIFMGKIDL